MRRPPGDARPARSFVIVSRQALRDSNYSTVVCAPIFSERYGLPTQVDGGREEGLKHDRAVHCDGLMSLEKSRLHALAQLGFRVRRTPRAAGRLPACVCSAWAVKCRWYSG